jgi:AhpD family alkylhydroperoxidase
MARVALVDPRHAPEPVKAQLEAIARDRGQAYNVYRMLANSPIVLERLYAFIWALWHESQIEPALQETVIMRVAQLSECDYEWGRHRELARRAGLSDGKVAALMDWQASSLFTEVERSVLAVVDSATLRVASSAEEITDLKRFFSDRQVVELLALTSLYGMLARLIRSLDVELEPGAVGLPKVTGADSGG